MSVQLTLPEINGAGKGKAAPLSSAAYFDAQQKIPALRTPRRGVRVTPRQQLGSPVSAHNKRQRHEKPAVITVYADMVKVGYPEVRSGVQDRDRSQNGGIRGNVSGFSRASRKRMLEFMAKVRDQGDMYFVTMTYDDWSWLKKTDDHHADFEAFRHRFERAFPNWKAVWRVEIKERKSGMLEGSRVPHFHLLVFTGRNDDEDTKRSNEQGLQAWGVRAWGEILQAENPHFSRYGFHVSTVRNRRHAYSYVSKYIGKQDDDDIECGRRWGRIGRFDCSSSEIIPLTDDEATYFKRMIKRWLRNRSPRYACRFAKQTGCSGYTVFGLGDTTASGESPVLFTSIDQFVVEVKRWHTEKTARETSSNIWD